MTMRTGASFSFKAVGDRHLTVLGAFRPCARPRIVSAHDLGGLDQAGRNELGHGIRSLMGTSTLRRHALLNTKSIIDVAQRSLLSTRAKMTGYFPSSPSESTQTQSPEELIREATSLKHQCEMVPVGKLTSRDAVDILSTITELHWTYMPLLNLQPQLELQNGNITHGFDGDTSVPGQWFAASSKDGEAAAVLASSLLHRLIDDNVAGQNPAAHPGNTNICDMVSCCCGTCCCSAQSHTLSTLLDSSSLLSYWPSHVGDRSLGGMSCNRLWAASPSDSGSLARVLSGGY